MLKKSGFSLLLIGYHVKRKKFNILYTTVYLDKYKVNE